MFLTRTAASSNNIPVSHYGKLHWRFEPRNTLTCSREWGLLTAIPVGILLIIVATKSIWMPTWTYFVALGFGAAAMLPMSLVYAMSGYSIKVGFFNELIYGCKCLTSIRNGQLKLIIVFRYDRRPWIISPSTWSARLPHHIRQRLV